MQEFSQQVKQDKAQALLVQRDLSTRLRQFLQSSNGLRKYLGCYFSFQLSRWLIVSLPHCLVNWYPNPAWYVIHLTTILSVIFSAWQIMKSWLQFASDRIRSLRFHPVKVLKSIAEANYSLDCMFARGNLPLRAYQTVLLNADQCLMNFEKATWVECANPSEMWSTQDEITTPGLCLTRWLWVARKSRLFNNNRKIRIKPTEGQRCILFSVADRGGDFLRDGCWHLHWQRLFFFND